MIRVQFWGTRGGIPTPQWATGRYGGNTSCVQVTGFQDDTPGAVMRPGNPQVILDGGTGLLTMQPTLMSGPVGQGRGELHFLLSHYHWDHILGIAFFKPLFLPGNRVVFYGATVEELRASIERLFASVYSPIRDQDLAADLAYRQVALDGMEVAGFDMRAAHNVHQAGSLSFRLQYGPHAVVYTTDHGVGDPSVDSRLVELARGADLWILAALLSEKEKRAYPYMGHSTHLEVTRLAVEAEVKTAILFHHALHCDDSALDRRELEAAELAKGTRTTVLTARDGMVMEIGNAKR
jgi:phosphoribosyl 1,2-cyclic phosphodiesterase